MCAVVAVAICGSGPVDVPDELLEEQEQLLREFAALRGEDVAEPGQAFSGVSSRPSEALMTGVPPNGQHGPHVLVDSVGFPSSLTMIVITLAVLRLRTVTQ